MLTVGDRFPEFRLQAAVSLDKGKEFQRSTTGAIPGRGKSFSTGRWTSRSSARPKIAEFGRRNADFRDRDAPGPRRSTDNQYVHLAWRRTTPI